MNREERERLLGGYATNSLTEQERKALFEAALDDQGLFDALGREQPLRELLDDPVSRAQVQRALENPRPPKAPWWRQWRAWSAVAGAAAVSVTAFVLVNSGHESSKTAVAMTAQRDTAVKAPAPPVSVPRLERKQAAPNPRAGRSAGAVDRAAPRQESRTAPKQEPARDQEQSSTVAATGSVVGGLAAPTTAPAAASPPPPAPASPPAPAQPAEARPLALAGSAGFGRLASAPPSPLRYSVVKLDANGSYTPVDSGAAVREGDAVRLNVQSSAAGYLKVYLRDASGGWQPLFPSNGQGIKVDANATYTVPDAPIEVKQEEKVRLILTTEPVLGSEADAIAKSKSSNSRRAKAIEIEPHQSSRGAPIFVDITLNPKKE